MPSDSPVRVEVCWSLILAREVSISSKSPLIVCSCEEAPIPSETLSVKTMRPFSSVARTAASF